MKKVCSLLLVLAMVLSLFGGAVAEGPTEIVLWHNYGGANGIAIEQMIADYNASQTDVVLTGVYQGSYNDLLTKIKAGMVSNDLPNLVVIAEYASSFMMQMEEYIVPAQNFIDKFNYDTSATSDQFLYYYSLDGVQYAMPFAVSCPMLIYNKDAFKAAGLDPEVAPKNYEEVLAYAEKLTTYAADGTVERYGYGQWLSGMLLGTGFAKMGMYYVDNENGRAAKATAVSDQFVEGAKIQIDTWMGLLDSGYCVNLGSSYNDYITALAAGNLAMTASSCANLASIYNAVNGAFEIGVAEIPTYRESENGGVNIGGTGIWVLNVGSDVQKDASWDFVTFAEKPEVQAAWSIGTGYVATAVEAYETDLYKAKLAEYPTYLEAFKALTAYTPTNLTTGSLFPAEAEARTLYVTALQDVIDGNLTSEEAAETLAEDINDAISNYYDAQ